jgi:hypothetical protein
MKEFVDSKGEEILGYAAKYKAAYKGQTPWGHYLMQLFP